jgi:hypothetical protein
MNSLLFSALRSPSTVYVRMTAALRAIRAGGSAMPLPRMRALHPRPRSVTGLSPGRWRRKRAWEQKRAAASGRSAIEIVERLVTVPTPQPRPLPRQLGCVDLLRVLAQQLDGGAVYDRHLVIIAVAPQDVLGAAPRPSLRTRPDPHVGRREWRHLPG